MIVVQSRPLELETDERQVPNEYVLHLLRRAVSHRELAANCRQVAPGISLEAQRAQLLAYADRLDREAALLEEQAARFS